MLVTDIFLAQRYNLAFPSIPYGSDARIQSVSRIDPTLPQVLKARAAVFHRVRRKAQSMACA